MSLLNIERPHYPFRDKPNSVSEAQLAANRANAQKSTGPVTNEGRAISSRNALKHGLTGNTVLLDSDDAEAYQQRLDAYVAQYQPVTLEERRLVQSIHDSAWRLDRILNLESTIYAKGRIELQFCFEDLPEDQRKSFVELEIMQRNRQDLRNLALQETRLQRQRAKDIVALEQLIAKRKAEEKAAAEKSTNTAPVHCGQEQNGFVFANHQTPDQPAPATAPPTPQLTPERS